MLDRLPLLVRQPGGDVTDAPLKRRILARDGASNEPPIDATIPCRMKPLRTRRHARLDLDHLPRRIASELDLTRFRVRALGL